MRSNILLLACILTTFLYAHVQSNIQLDQQFHGVQDAVLSKEGSGDGRENVVNREAVYTVKGQKGKGAYGGGNIDHKPSKSGATERSGPSMYVLSAAVCVSVWMLIRMFVF